MNPLAFNDLAGLPMVQYYARSFRTATGVSLRIVPPEVPLERRSLGASDNGFCSLLTCSTAGCAACLAAEQQVLESATRRRVLQQTHCYAGLTVVAIPVLAGERHVATLLTGQVFRREPTERDFQMVMKMLGGLDAEQAKRARKAYFETPVLTADRFQAVLQLLNVFAQTLAQVAERQAIASSASEPAAVANAKQFVQTHAEEPITLAQVVEHVHVSRFYFCKLFRRATGMTLTEYVTRVRLEKAKSLLVNPSLRISEIVFAAGFGSVPRFNSVFKRYVGMAPKEYRANLRPSASV